MQIETRSHQRDAVACDFTREQLNGAKFGLKSWTIVATGSVSCNGEGDIGPAKFVYAAMRPPLLAARAAG